MYFFFDKRKPSREKTTVALIWLLLFCMPCPAQEGQRSPDSVHVGDTDSLSGQNNNQGNATTGDTVGAVIPDALKDDSIITRSVPDSVAAAYKRNADFAYANDSGYWGRQPVKQEHHLFDFIQRHAEWFRGSLLVLLLAILLFAAYQIFVANKLNLFYTVSGKNRDGDSRETDLPTENLAEKIQEADRSGDFRLALRYRYLQALKIAADKELIRYHAGSTNQDYVDQLLHHPLQTDFRFLANAYEHIWYGGFDVKREQFDLIRDQFNHFFKAMDY